MPIHPGSTANKACLYQILFEAVADTLLTFGADPRHHRHRQRTREFELCSDNG